MIKRIWFAATATLATLLFLVVGMTTDAWAATQVTPTATESVSQAGMESRTVPSAPAAVPATCAQLWYTVPTDPVPSSRFQAIEAAGPNDVWAVGYYLGGSGWTPLVEHWDGSAWRVAQTPLATGTLLYGLAVINSNDVWAVGTANNRTLTAHWDGTAWTVVPSPNVGTGNNVLNDVAALSSTDVWAVGGRAVEVGYQTLTMHWDGTAWTVVNSPNPSDYASIFRGVAFAGPNDVWAVGKSTIDPLTAHWNGTAWSVVSTPPPPGGVGVLYSVTATGPNDAWAVGYAQTVNPAHFSNLTYHWDGVAWRGIPTPNKGTTDNYLYAVDVAGPNSVFAVGNNTVGGVVLHWTGNAWSVRNDLPNDGAGMSFMAVVGVDLNDVWAVGPMDIAVRYACPLPTATPTATRTPSPTRTPTATATCNPTGNFTVSGSVTGTDPTMHSVNAAVAGSCGNNPCPGDLAGSFHYDAYHYTNPSSSPICVTVSYAQPCLFSAAYLATYDPNNGCANFLGGAGQRGPTSYSFTVPGNATFWVMAEEFSETIGCANYTMTITGIPQSCGVPSPTSIPTNTPTRTNTATNTATNTPTNTATNTPTSTRTSTAIPTTTNTATRTNTPTNTPTNTRTNTATPSSTTTNAPTGTLTATRTPTQTPTGTSTATNTPSSTSTSTSTASNTATRTSTPLNTATNTPTQTATSTLTSTNTATNTPSPTGTATYIATNTPTTVPSNTVSSTSTSTRTNTATSTPTATSTTTVTGTPSGTATGTNTTTPAVTATAIYTTTGTPTNTPLPATGTSTATSTPTLTSTASVPTSTLTQVPTSTPASTETHTPTITDTPVSTPTPALASSATPTLPSSVTPTTCVLSFEDAHPDDWFYQYVRYLFCRGVVGGYYTIPPCSQPGATCFKPANTTTRGQITKIVALAFNLPINTQGGPHFSDVMPGSTFYDYIETGYNLGILGGYPDGTFRPSYEVSRGQITRIVVNAAIATDPVHWALSDPSTSTFEDVPAGSTYFRYVETAAAHGVVSGYPCGTLPAGQCVPPLNKPYFVPSGNATRAQISKITYIAATYGR